MAANTNLQGRLKDFGLVEVLQMMELGSMTGAIHLKQATGRIGILYINKGKLANCSELDAGALTLGDVLQQLGIATYQQMEQAFSQQVKDAFGKRIGERLVGMGVITRKQLHETLRTKVLWTARELALWQDGTYEFISGANGQSILPYGEVSFDLEIMRITMEMVRYIDEWEELQQYLPQGMRTTLRMASAIPYAMNFDARTVEIIGQVNLCRRVRRIATAVRRPELEVARELARLVQQKFLQVVQEVIPPSNGSSVSLPAPAEQLRMEGFQMLDLINHMEQEWYKKHTPMEQLPTLIEFINWTMDTLAEACRVNRIELNPDTLKLLLASENLRYMGNYEFKVDQNHMDVDNFTSLCHEVMQGDMQNAADFYDEAVRILQSILRCIFEMINARVASLHERLENQEVWEALFGQFELQRIQ